MKVLVYGSKGWIGTQFCDILKNTDIHFLEGVSRLDDNASVKNEIQTVNPTHVISFTGRTHGGEYTTIDYLEQKGKLQENIRDNLYSVLYLANVCKEMNIHYTYLGTGCIFEGNEDTLFHEDSKPNFFGSSYSVVKGFTDRLMHDLFEEHVLNLRIRMPITNNSNPRNFITKITHYEKICSMPNSMTVLPELLPYIIDLMKMKKVGTLNFTNPGVISHNEILEMYKTYVDSSFTWNNFSIEEQKLILKSERSNNHLDTTELQSLFPNILPIKESISNIMMDYKK